MDNTKELTHISLCAGYGGIDLGLKRAVGALRTIAFSEIEGYACANLVQKMEKNLLDPAPIWTNLKTFPWEEFYKKVDILSGGFPCQPFSSSGKREGDKDPRHLWPFIIKGIKELGKPPIVFFENVEGLLSSTLKGGDWADMAGTPVLLHVLRELERLGYRATAGLFSACEVGASHQRKRVFIIGIHKDIQKKEIKKIESRFKSIKPISYPSHRGLSQFKWEQSRYIKKLDNSYSARLKQSLLFKLRKTRKKNFKEISNMSVPSSSLSRNNKRKKYNKNSQSSLGRAAYGVACRLDSNKPFIDLRTVQDEFRLLGNGVVPDTACKAFITLFKEITKDE